MTPKDSNLPILPNDTMPKNHETYSTSNNVNGFQSPTSSLKTGENKKRCDSLTQEELDELNEEPLNTENALEAVMGYIPKDDKRICRFSDPKTNACFKGSKCKLEHTTILKGIAPSFFLALQLLNWRNFVAFFLYNVCRWMDQGSERV